MGYWLPSPHGCNQARYPPDFIVSSLQTEPVGDDQQARIVDCRLVKSAEQELSHQIPYNT